MKTGGTFRLLLSLTFMFLIQMVNCSIFYIIGVESFKHALMALIPVAIVLNLDKHKKIAERIAGCKFGDETDFVTKK